MIIRILMMLLALILIVVLALIPWALPVVLSAAAALWWYKQRRWKAGMEAAVQRGEDPLKGAPPPSTLRLRILGPYLANRFPGRPRVPRD